MRKLLISIGLALVITLTFLTGVSLATRDKAKKKLTMLIGGDLGGWRTLVEKFEKQHPDIEVDLIEGPPTTDIRENMYTVSFVAKKGYDLVFMDVVWMAKFASAGWLVPLDDYVKKSGIKLDESFFPGDIEASVYKGHIYRIPVQSDVGLLYYRKDWLEEFGYTEEDLKTWSNVKKIAKEIAEKKTKEKGKRVYGIVFQGKQYEGLVCNFLEYLWAFGGEVAKGNKVVIYSPQSIKALAFMRSLLAENIAPQSVITYEEEESKNAFEQGLAVFMRNWPYVSIGWSIRNSEFLEKGGVTMIPGETNPGTPNLGGWGLGISAYTPYKEEAWTFIRFVIQPENLKILYEKNNMLPALRSLYDDPELIAKNKFFPKYKEALSRARPRPKHPAYARVSDLIQFYVSSALVGRMTPEKAIKGLQRDLSKIY